MMRSSRLRVCERTAGTLTLIRDEFVVCESRLAALRDTDAAPVSVSLIEPEAEMLFFIPLNNHYSAEN